MAEMSIAPGYLESDFPKDATIEDRIELFARRIQGWILDVADQCIYGGKKDVPHSGFAVLSIVFSYFEMIAKYQSGYPGRDKPRHYFRLGVDSVFPELRRIIPSRSDELYNILYYAVRCALYHNGITDPRVILSGCPPAPILPAIDEKNRLHVVVNPRLLVTALKNHMADYRERLRDPNNVVLRQSFERRWLALYKRANRSVARELTIVLPQGG